MEPYAYVRELARQDRLSHAWLLLGEDREALEKLSADPRWEGLRRVAVGCGYGPAPTVPGWEYLTPDNASVVFDSRLTPVFVVVGPDGLVEQSYTLAL